MELLDYLKSNCRSWEVDCDTQQDAEQLASHLQDKFPKINPDEIYQAACDWVGFEPLN